MPATGSTVVGTTAPAIEDTGLVRRYGTTTALAGVDLAASPGTVLGVLGVLGPTAPARRPPSAPCARADHRRGEAAAAHLS